MTTTWARATFAVLTAALLAAAAGATTQSPVSDTYTDYDGGLPVAQHVASDTYTDYDGGLPVGSDPTTAVLAEIHLRANATPLELGMAEPHVRRFCSCSGDTPALLHTLQTAARMGCRGECFAQVAQCMEEGVTAGLSAEQSAEVVIASLFAMQYWCDQQGERSSDRAFAEQLGSHFAERLASRY